MTLFTPAEYAALSARLAGFDFQQRLARRGLVERLMGGFRLTEAGLVAWNEARRGRFMDTSVVDTRRLR